MSAGAAAPLLEVAGLRIEARGEHGWDAIVHGVDFTLRRGEVLGLIGESGAGKSTIGLAAMGYARDGCRIAGGSIRFDGTDLATAGEGERRRLRGARIAYVAQSAAAAFNPAHRLIDQFAEAPLQHGVDDRRAAEAHARELFARLQLPDPERIGQRYPFQVSGGQLQRAMTAMAMSCRPDLIVFDEPTTALDVTTQIEVLAAIKRAITEEDTAALYITHDLAVVAQVADRIMVLRDGRTVEVGSTEQILTEPREDYTRQLVGVRSTRKLAQLEPAPPLLELHGVNAGYSSGPRVLHDVHLALPVGRTVAVVGESGSGKSTLARVVTGLLPPESGGVRFDGEELPPALPGRSKEQLRRLQMVYQMPDVALNPRQRVADVLGRPLQFYFGLSAAERRRRVATLLEQIELGPEFARRYPGELSGGQKQRVCIARALAAEPRLIICDEPTSALDPLVAEGILQLLLRLQRESGVAYLFITHDLATVRAIADWIVVMYQGRIVEQGTKDEVLTPPHHDYTDLLLKSVPEMEIGWLERVLATRRLASAGH